MSVFLDQLVVKQRYLSEDELIELMALCSILPGPTSTQVIVAIGYKTGGPWLALLAMLVWALPALFIMTLLSFLYQGFAAHQVPTASLRFLGPMAVGFVVVAAFRIGGNVVRDVPTGVLLVGGALVTYFIRTPWFFPLALLAGGGVAAALYREEGMWKAPVLRPPWRYLVLFAVCALGLLALSLGSSVRIVQLTESFFRYGYLVFGGGQVVVPLMHNDLVHGGGYLTNEEFLTGYGLVQGLPGPMFSFAAYAGGMAARGGSWCMQVAGAVAGGVGIFLPGLLLIYFVYPVWDQLKAVRAVRIALRGINAVAGGMIAAVGLRFLLAMGLRPDLLAAVAVSVVLLWSRKVPAPLIVGGALVAGFFF